MRVSASGSHLGAASRSRPAEVEATWPHRVPGVIYLLRHGDAEDGIGDDCGPAADRRRGRARPMPPAGPWRPWGRVDTCLTSPKVRAAETARLACEALGIDPEKAPELSGGRFDALALAAGRGNVLLVGHEPDLSAEVARLTGANAKLTQGRPGDRRRLHPDRPAAARAARLEDRQTPDLTTHKRGGADAFVAGQEDDRPQHEVDPRRGHRADAGVGRR